MIIEKIKLKNFRNYEYVEIKLNEEKNLFIGGNANGKTNILEGIYISSFARSFRTNNIKEVIKFGEERSFIETKIKNKYLEKEIKITIEKNGKKNVIIDGKKASNLKEFLKETVIIIFSPEDLKIIKEDPEKRRRFLNREISQLKPFYYENIKNYYKVLKEKNIVLKKDCTYKKEEILKIYNEQLYKYGSVIIKEREKFIKELEKKTIKIHERLTKEKEKINIKYEKNIEENDFLETINKEMKREEKVGYSLVGPHKDDISFFINGKDIKKYGSQGQQRLLTLSLKLAEVDIAKEEIGENPIILLDDVFSELDILRRKALFEEIKNIQVLITDTEIDNEIIKEKEKYKIYNICEGKVLKN